MARPDPNRPRYVGGSPGLSGAIKDAVSAVADAVTPSVMKPKPREAAVDQQTDDTISRMRSAQSTDSNNEYSY